MMIARSLSHRMKDRQPVRAALSGRLQAYLRSDIGIGPGQILWSATDFTDLQGNEADGQLPSDTPIKDMD